MSSNPADCSDSLHFTDGVADTTFEGMDRTRLIADDMQCLQHFRSDVLALSDLSKGDTECSIGLALCARNDARWLSLR